MDLATKGLFDALSYLAQQPSLLKPFTLKIIPMLNPDGAAAYTRVNANDIDLNRDALYQTQPESRLLVETFHAFKPHYCFNLHDQRTIFGVNNSPCMLSFLAPAADKDKTVRLLSRHVAAKAASITSCGGHRLFCY